MPTWTRCYGEVCHIGIFVREDAGHPISKGTELSRYAGCVIKCPSKEQQNGRYLIELDCDKGLFIDGEGADPREGIAQVANTCIPGAKPPFDRANCMFWSDGIDVTLHTTRNVYPGEELLVDYHWHFKALRRKCGCRFCVEAGVR